jgi:hypothetical protein
MRPVTCVIAKTKTRSKKSSSGVTRCSRSAIGEDYASASRIRLSRPRSSNAVDISVPADVMVFPGEIYRAPRSWGEHAYRDLIYFNEVDKGRPLRGRGKSRNSSPTSSERRSGSLR